MAKAAGIEKREFIPGTVETWKSALSTLFAVTKAMGLTLTVESSGVPNY